jgi:protein-tyrosine phosphatase
LTAVPPFTVLHVCMGNICRSPMAERLLVYEARALVGDRVDDLLLVHGAGTGGWHVGAAMDPSAARQVRARGGDPSRFAARQLARDMISTADLVLCATGEQREFVEDLFGEAADRTFVLGEVGRLLPKVDMSALPRAGGSPDAVYARGVALVEALAEARGGQPPQPGDDLDDPWGRGDGYFARVADEIAATVRPLARALLHTKVDRRA